VGGGRRRVRKIDIEEKKEIKGNQLKSNDKPSDFSVFLWGGGVSLEASLWELEGWGRSSKIGFPKLDFQKWISKNGFPKWTEEKWDGGRELQRRRKNR
jgi:hypothetical protein